MSMTPSRRHFLQAAAGAAAVGITTAARSFGNTHMLQVAMNFPAPPGPDRLPPEWYQRKIRQVQAKMAERNLNALVLLNAHNVVYTTGYFHLPTERPLAVLIPASGEPALFVPGLESDQVKLWWIKDVEVYFDYPGPVNRVQWIFERINARGLGGGTIGIEECTPSRLAHIQAGAPKAKLMEAGDIVEQMRWVKDPGEIGVMRRATYFADYTVAAGRAYIEANGSVTENQILKASADAVADKMGKELTSVVGVGIDPPFGGLVPFGKRSAFPHAVPSSDKLKKGDALILSLGAMVGGYNVECERSFSVGPPSDHAKKLFDAMLAAHDMAAANMKEGMVAEEVDAMSLDQIRKAGFAQFLKHRTGHGIGLEGHEPPWIAEGDKTVLKVGMTFSCEPGVYDPNWGGFRHSDTVIVGETRGEIINKYPTRLNDMTITI
ncbi:MAG TPA: Xaa-Pro peptidase family protein [Candidatus Eisenbacteria bacterium]|nr:Xaa-Pro peptidase family protein [Candidatus Eisenbacteria bacterium]